MEKLGCSKMNPKWCAFEDVSVGVRLSMISGWCASADIKVRFSSENNQYMCGKCLLTGGGRRPGPLAGAPSRGALRATHKRRSSYPRHPFAGIPAALECPNRRERGYLRVSEIASLDRVAPGLSKEAFSDKLYIPSSRNDRNGLLAPNSFQPYRPQARGSGWSPIPGSPPGHPQRPS